MSIYFDKRYSTYRVRLIRQSTEIYLGSYKSLEEAEGVESKALVKYPKRVRNTNMYLLKDSHAIIITSKNEEILVDLEDLDKCKLVAWYVSTSNGYARGRFNDKLIYLHKYILLNKSISIDHRDRNKLNCRKENLREANYSLNNFNKGIKSNNISGCVGVVKIKRNNTWHAQIGFKGNNINLGYFEDIEDAIKARREAEIKYYGEYCDD